MSPVPESAPPVFADTATVSCDGDGEAHDGGGHLGSSHGHPRVYLKIGDTGEVVCPYCSRRFILAEGAKTASGQYGH